MNIRAKNHRDNLRNEAPILILAYNRADLFIGCIDRLLSNGFNNIYVSIDGPRNDKDEFSQSKIKNHLQARMVPESKVRHRSENAGCRVGVIEGITWFFSIHKMGIINEDDVEIEPRYMDVMIELLNKHEPDKQFFSISAHSEPDMEREDGDLGLHMSPVCRVGGGWASWSDRWQQHLSVMQKTAKLSPVQTFNSLPKPYRTSSIAMKVWTCRKNYMDAWDYEWNLTHIVNKAFSITPSGVYSINHGYREDGSHTKTAEDKPWEVCSKPWKTINGVIRYEEMKPQYIGILRKCGLEHEKSRWVWEALKVYSYKPYNKLVIAPLRKMRGLLRPKKNI